MVELLESDEKLNFQFLICEHCGVTHCETGNWVSIRKSGNYILFIPAFDQMLETSDSDEYKPPNFLKTKGFLLLTVQEFENLKEKVPAFSKITELKYLSGLEAAFLYKWDAPQRMFGNFPDFKSFRNEHILWTNELDTVAVSIIILEKLKNMEPANTIQFIPLDNLDTSISIFLEGGQTVEWKGICKTPNGYELLMGDSFKLVAR